MAGRHVMVLALVMVAVAFAGVEADRKIGDCTHNKDCGPLSCCVVGRMRYSIPTCSLRLRLGARCNKPSSTPFSGILHYPDGGKVEIEAGHRGMCPCQPGLVCLKGTCQHDPYDKDDDNYDDNYDDKYYDQ